MKFQSIIPILVVLVVVIVPPLDAQTDLNLPDASQNAAVMQRVGITDIPSIITVRS